MATKNFAFVDTVNAPTNIDTSTYVEDTVTEQSFNNITLSQIAPFIFFGAMIFIKNPLVKIAIAIWAYRQREGFESDNALGI